MAWPCGQWTRTAAEEYCEAYLTEKIIAQKCFQLPSIDYRDEVDSCVEDIKVWLMLFKTLEYANLNAHLPQKWTIVHV